MTLVHLEQIDSADTVEELWELHTEKMAAYGFDRLLYGYTRFKTSTSLGDPYDCLVLTNHGPEYVDGWVTDGHYFHAPMLRWTLENDGACSWSWMEKMALEDAFTEGERKVMEYNRRMGVTAGYTISFKSSSPRNKGGMALTARRGMSQVEVDHIWDRHGRDILIMNNTAHLKIISLPHGKYRRPLTPRQREVLEWVGDGKTMQDIATIMGLNLATVEKHLRLAREALNVDTTAQAVLKASFQNQIFVLEA